MFAPIIGQMLVSAASFLVGLSLVLIDLLSDGMSDWKHELWPKSEIGAKTLGEVFWRVVGIVDVPFKLVTKHNIADSHIKLDNFH